MSEQDDSLFSGEPEDEIFGPGKIPMQPFVHPNIPPIDEDEIVGIDDAGIVVPAGAVLVLSGLLTRAYAFLEGVTVREPDELQAWRKECRRCLGL